MTQEQIRQCLLVEAEKLYQEAQAQIREMESFLRYMRRRPLTRPESRVLADSSMDIFKLVFCECADAGCPWCGGVCGEPATLLVYRGGLEETSLHVCGDCAALLLQAKRRVSVV